MSGGQEFLIRGFVPPHDIKHGSLPYCRPLSSLREGDGRVPCHEEVAARGGDKGGHEADEVVVHIARVAQCGG